MQYVKESKLSNFEFWSGAKYLADMLTIEEFECIEDFFEESPDLMSETSINDCFWFDRDFLVCEILGFSSWEDFEESRQDE